MKKILLLLALASPTFAAHFKCTAGGSGNLTAINWTNCNSTYPNNRNGDTYSIVANNQQVVIDVDITVGRSLSGWDATFDHPTDTVSCGQCSFVNGDFVRLTMANVLGNVGSGTVWPIGLGQGDYYVVNANGSTFQLSTTSGGAPTLFTSNGSVGIKITGADPAIQTLGTGAVTVGAGVTLRQRGDLRIGTPPANRDVFILSAGSRYIVDSSQATNPDKTSYCVFTPSAVLLKGASMRVNGTKSSPVTWESDLTNGALPSGKCAHQHNQTYGGDLIASYLIAKNVGGTVHNVFWSHTPIATTSIEDSVLDGCGPIMDIGGSPNSVTATVKILRTRFINTPAAHGRVNVSINMANALTTGVRLIQDNYFDGIFGRNTLPAVRDVTFRNNVFGRSPIVGCSGAIAWTQFTNGIVFSPNKDADAFFSLCGHTSDLMFVSTAGGNIRGVAATYGSLSPVLYDGIMCEVALEFNTSDGDCWGSSGGSPAALAQQTAKLSNYISLPGQSNGVRFNAGTFGTGGIPNISQIEIENMTEMGGQGPNGVGNAGSGNNSVILSESGVGGTGRLAWFKGVLHWDIPRAIPSKHLGAGNPNTAVNTANPANMDYNACFNCAPSTRWGEFDVDGLPPWTKTGTVALTNYNTFYDVPMTGIVPGQNDLNGVDPNFVDDTRNIESWSVKFHGKSGNVAGAMSVFSEADPAELGKMISHALNWIRQGFAPREIRYAVPAAPRGRIGAVAPVLMFGTINQ